VTSDQSQAARQAQRPLGYRPPVNPPKAPPRREEPPADLSGDVSAAAWTIGHGAYVAEWEVDEREARAGRRRARARLMRLRLYSYCMTLSACVLALMAFMYLLTGTADGDAGFTSIGVMFLGMMIVMLWGALRVTRAGEQH
jgi:hypothetical protein